MQVDKTEIIEYSRKYGILGTNKYCVNIEKFIKFYIDETKKNNASDNFALALNNIALNGELLFEMLYSILHATPINCHCTAEGIVFFSILNGTYKKAKLVSEENFSKVLCIATNNNFHTFDRFGAHNKMIIHKLMVTENNLAGFINVFSSIIDTTVAIEGVFPKNYLLLCTEGHPMIELLYENGVSIIPDESIVIPVDLFRMVYLKYEKERQLAITNVDESCFVILNSQKYFIDWMKCVTARMIMKHSQ